MYASIILRTRLIHVTRMINAIGHGGRGRRRASGPTSPWSSTYESVWTTTLSIHIGSAGISTDLRHWVNEGLMTFFLVVGLEAKRELDLGELRERRRLAIPWWWRSEACSSRC